MPCSATSTGGNDGVYTHVGIAINSICEVMVLVVVVACCACHVFLCVVCVVNVCVSYSLDSQNGYA